MAVVIGLRVDVPRDGPDPGGNLLQPASLAHLFFEERAVDGREGFDGDKEVGARGLPGRAVLREAPARDDVVDMGMILELPTPRMQDPGEPREVSADEALVIGQPLESRCRRLKHRLVREALM